MRLILAKARNQNIVRTFFLIFALFVSTFSFANLQGFSKIYCLRESTPKLGIQYDFENDVISYTYENGAPRTLKNLKLRSEYKSLNGNISIKAFLTNSLGQEQIALDALLNYKGTDLDTDYIYPAKAIYYGIRSRIEYKMACRAKPLVGHAKVVEGHKNFGFVSSVHKIINYCFAKALDEKVVERFESHFIGDALRSGFLSSIGILQNNEKTQLRNLAKKTNFIPKTNEQKVQHAKAKWNYCETLSSSLEGHIRKVLADSN